jgi:amino acid adenylation domain-containing protein
MRIDGELFIHFLRTNKIEVSDATPSHLQLLLASIYGSDLKLYLKNLLVGGEPLSKQILSDFFDAFKIKGLCITNVYGPAECCVDATSHGIFREEVEYLNQIPIGKSLPNVNVYVLDNGNKLVPIGIPGELCISGLGVSRGYLNRPTFTEDTFINHPFLCGEKLYKTGDLGRWMPDGNIEFLGRIDHQVKIRGFRIEPGEITNQLLKTDLVKECVVIDRERNGETYLCAYIVPERHMQGTEPPVELRKVLSAVLPDYMIPSHFIELDRIPLNPNGKVDRKCLPEPKIEAGEQYLAPRNKDERRLVQLWSEVLGIKREAISIDANFFEVGGHSLKATILISKIHRTFNVRIPLGAMFVNPTIEGLSKVIREKEGISDEYAKIEVSEKKEYYPLSPAQKRLYILQQMEVKNTSYNLPGIIELGEEVELDRLEEAFRKIISRHESLRTSFDMVNSEPVQKINREVDFKIEHYHLKSDGDDINSDNDHSFIARGVSSIMGRFVRFFDLSKAPLLRVGIINGEFSNSILVFDLHHIITDGISQNLLEQEFYTFYSGGELPLLRLQYKDFAGWQNNNIRQGLLKEQEEYWIHLFSDELPALHLPSDFSRPLIRSFEGAAVRFVLNPEETKEIKAVARENDATLFMVMLSIFTIFLSKLSGSSRGGDQEDIIVGTPIAGRRHADLENIIGMFVNSLALRNSPAGDKSYKEFLDEVKQRTLEAFENQEYQFEDLVERVEVNRDTSRNPLFDVMFVFQNMDISGREISGLTVNPYDYENRTSRFDLTLQGIERGDNLFFILEYCTKLFKKEIIDRLISYFRRALSIILTEPEIKIFEIDIVSKEEKQQMLFEFNDTNVDYPNDKTLHALFEEQAEKTPGNTAIIYEDNQLTYKELNKKANQLANYLYYEKHVQFEYLIGIYMEDPIKQVIAMLGILKAGCAYVPIDAYIPHARVKDMLDDSKIEIVISQKRYINALNKLQCECQSFKSFLCLDSHNLYLEEETGKNELNHGLDLDLKTENAAYLIYTSGSTGKPKGAIVEHKSVVNTLFCRGNEYKLKTNDTILQLFSYAFDGFVTSFFTPIISGAKVILQSRDGMKDISNIIVSLINNCVTHFISVPPLYQTIIEIISEYDKDCLKVVTLAGDKILPGVIEKTKEKRKNFEIAIEYGITEVSVMSTIFRNQQGSERIKIGKPIWNTKIYVVNKQNHSQPIGVAGELSIAGVGLARGYLNNKKLTNEKFIDSPFVKGEKLFRTGDLARWLTDGNIEFLGRLDDQVKIRGYRIELGEIENQLERHGYISKAVVLVKEERENQSLYAYIVSNGEGEISKSDLREYLLRTLPDYMIPSHFVPLENIPLTPIGKIDKKALLSIEIEVGEEYIAPSNEIEKKLVAIWSEILGIKKDVISIDSNFFNLGGNSLKVTILAAKMHKEFDVKVVLAEIFRFPTVRNLSEYLKVALKEKYSVIKSIEKKEYYPLSSSQERLFLLQQMDVNSTGYNLPQISILEGNINIKKFENIFQALINRHESFRTSFKLIEEIPKQIIRDDVNFKIEYKNLDKSLKNIEGDEGKEEIIQKVYRDFIKPFSLSQAPLIRVKLVKIGIEKFALMIDMHHIITDGISIGILLKEFIMLFDEKQLQKIRIFFKDFTQWQNDILNSQEIEKQRDYWLKQFENDTPSLNLPMDYNRPSDKDYDGSSVVLELSEKHAISLKKLAFEEEMTMFMIFFAAYNIFLSKICDQDDIIVGVPVGGRRHADLESMVGMFVNTLAIRSFPSGEKTFIEFLKEVKKTTLDAFENQDYQFEDLVEKLAIPRNPGRNPLFDVAFDLQEYNLKFKALHSRDTTIKIKDYKLKNTTSYFDLSLVCSLNEKKIYLFFEYRIKLFKKSTIERFIEYFDKILSYIVENKKIKLKDINISHDLIDIRTELFPDNDNDFGF